MANPTVFRAAAGAVGGLGAMGLFHAILALVSFGPLGPVAGSLAAVIQATIGNIGAGSAFAIAQSLAMGGIGVGAWLRAGVAGISAALGIGR